MPFYWLVVGTLCVWRVTHLLNAEDGPANLLVRLRRKAGGSFWGSLLDCFFCLSLWIAAPFAIVMADGVKHRALLWLAFSAGAILLERVTSKEPPTPIYFEDGEKNDVMLRESKNSAGDDLPSES